MPNPTLFRRDRQPHKTLSLVQDRNWRKRLLSFKWDDKGLLAAIIQEHETGKVLMLGYMNEEALRLTMESGHAWFWSRSRQELWHKGATSGNYLEVKEVWYDCDLDALLVRAKPIGPTCHTGNESCFYRQLKPADLKD
jgi:phosphoribosyl-AMP cyclohydrolase